jgi:hypothetical protein
MSESILAWHFSDGELRFDYAGTKVEAGLVLEKKELPLGEQNGFYASLEVLDALRWYAVRPQTEFILSRVRLSGEIIEEKQRLIAQKQEHLWVADVKPVLEEFAELQQRHPLMELVQVVVDLRATIYKWIYPENPHFDRLVNTDYDKHFIARIPLHPLGNQVTELSGYRFRLEQELFRLRVWEKAKDASFDLDAYRKENLHVLHWAGEMDEKTAKAVKHINDETALFRAIENPPQEFRDLVAAPKDPNEQFHEMLMRLAPEGYKE